VGILRSRRRDLNPQPADLRAAGRAETNPGQGGVVPGAAGGATAAPGSTGLVCLIRTPEPWSSGRWQRGHPKAAPLPPSLARRQRSARGPVFGPIVANLAEPLLSGLSWYSLSARPGASSTAKPSNVPATRSRGRGQRSSPTSERSVRRDPGPLPLSPLLLIIPIMGTNPRPIRDLFSGRKIGKGEPAEARYSHGTPQPDMVKELVHSPRASPGG
jgi:hypothetical protein